MMVPLPPPPPPDRPELPRVRLEVRTGSGRNISYEVGSDEFLIGGAPGCDLRLPIPNLPPVVCQITRKPDGVRVRRLAPGQPVLLNNGPLSGNTSTGLADGDRLTVAGVEVTLAIQFPTFVSAKLVPLNTAEAAPAAGNHRTPDGREGARTAEHDARRQQREDEDAARKDEWRRLDAELIRRRRELDQQTEELETDRVLWYQRRQEIEREAEQAQLATHSAAESQAALATRERELTQIRDELAAARQQFLDQYQDRRDELAQLQEQFRTDRETFDSELATRRAEAETAAAERLRQADEEIARRRAAFEHELAAHEPRVAELRAQQEQLAAATQVLAQQRDTFAADREALDQDRASLAVDREVFTSHEQAVLEREAALGHREEQLRVERETLDHGCEAFHADLLLLERRKAADEERTASVEAQAREVEARVGQLRHDAAEWEETLRLAAAEQDRLQAESERLDRQKTDLDTQTARLGERAAQLEAQQAVLAVLRAKLERTRAEVEREATALAAARVREDEAQAELRARIREAEQVRAELDTVQASAEQERRRLEERDSLLAAGLEEIRLQKEALAVEEARLQQRESELDVRSAEFAEQAGTLKGRMTQALDLQARLEADRVAIREREAALAQAEEARQALQEQLRRRAEDLAARVKVLDESARQLAADRTAVEQHQGTTAAQLDELRTTTQARAAELEQQAAMLAEREAQLTQQTAQIHEVGLTTADQRRVVEAERARWEAELAAAREADQKAREELEALRGRVAAEFEAMRGQAPELDEQARAALDRLGGARDLLRGHLTELNDFARQSREDLDAVRVQVRAEVERLREQETTLDRAKAEHRLAVTGFRQQLIEWQARVGEMKQALTRSETRLEARQAAVDEAARQADITSQQLAEQAEQLRRDREEVVQRRTEVERHLADMREWYRQKLRELADSRLKNEDLRLKIADLSDPGATIPAGEPSSLPLRSRIDNELDPGDRQLGELLRSLELVDADTLTALWAEAGRQRRTLRQVLLASGVVTLYQLALIEAGNLDALMLGRLRVIDRLRVTPREAIYRVFDPSRPVNTMPSGGAGGLPFAGGTSGATVNGGLSGVFLLRHLAEAEMHDAVRPDEFRQRFAAARDAVHPNLAGVVEVLEINGRPAAMLEWLTGLFSADWPPHAAHPGCWVRLMTMAAGAIDTAHGAGLAHGRLTSDSFVLTAGGVLKVTGFGEPPWLAMGPAAGSEPTFASDLRALGQVAFGWSQLAGKKKGPRAKPFPLELTAVIRRLEADAGPPMADTVAAEDPYETAADLLADLNRIARDTPFSDDAWDKLLRHVADNAPDAPATLRQSA